MLLSGGCGMVAILSGEDMPLLASAGEVIVLLTVEVFGGLVNERDAGRGILTPPVEDPLRLVRTVIDLRMILIELPEMLRVVSG